MCRRASTPRSPQRTSAWAEFLRRASETPREQRRTTSERCAAGRLTLRCTIWWETLRRHAGSTHWPWNCTRRQSRCNLRFLRRTIILARPSSRSQTPPISRTHTWWDSEILGARRRRGLSPELPHATMPRANLGGLFPHVLQIWHLSPFFQKFRLAAARSRAQVDLRHLLDTCCDTS